MGLLNPDLFKMDPLDQLEAAVRAHICRGDHAAGERLLSEYVRTLEGQSPAKIHAALEFMNWVRLAAFSQRALLAAQLGSLPRRTPYGGDVPSIPTWSAQA